MCVLFRNSPRANINNCDTMKSLDPKAEVSEEAQPPACPLHPSAKAKSVCLTCVSLVCPKCLRQHPKHELRSWLKVAQKLQSLLRKEIESLELLQKRVLRLRELLLLATPEYEAKSCVSGLDALGQWIADSRIRLREKAQRLPPEALCACYLQVKKEASGVDSLCEEYMKLISSMKDRPSLDAEIMENIRTVLEESYRTAGAACWKYRQGAVRSVRQSIPILKIFRPRCVVCYRVTPARQFWQNSRRVVDPGEIIDTMTHYYYSDATVADAVNLGDKGLIYIVFLKNYKQKQEFSCLSLGQPLCKVLYTRKLIHPKVIVMLVPVGAWLYCLEAQPFASGTEKFNTHASHTGQWLPVPPRPHSSMICSFTLMNNRTIFCLGWRMSHEFALESLDTSDEEQGWSVRLLSVPSSVADPERINRDEVEKLFFCMQDSNTSFANVPISRDAPELERWRLNVYTGGQQRYEGYKMRFCEGRYDLFDYKKDKNCMLNIMRERNDGRVLLKELEHSGSNALNVRCMIKKLQ